MDETTTDALTIRYLWDTEQAKHERTVARFIKAIIALSGVIVVMVAVIYLMHCSVVKTNQKWINYIEQFDFEDYGYQQDGRGVNIIGDMNGVDYQNYGTDIEGSETDTERRQSQRQGYEAKKSEKVSYAA